MAAKLMLLHSTDEVGFDLYNIIDIGNSYTFKKS